MRWDLGDTIGVLRFPLDFEYSLFCGVVQEVVIIANISRKGVVKFSSKHKLGGAGPD